MMLELPGATGGTEPSDGVKGRRASWLDFSGRQSCRRRLARSESKHDVTAELWAKDPD